MFFCLAKIADRVGDTSAGRVMTFIQYKLSQNVTAELQKSWKRQWSINIILT